MQLRTFILTSSVLLGACSGLAPDGAEVLTGDALAIALTDQRLTIAPPSRSGVVSAYRQVISLRSDGTAGMVGMFEGVPTAERFDTRQWEVRGQRLCIFEGASPEARDCIRVDWVGGGRFQLTELGRDGAPVTGIGTIAPI